MRCPACGGGPGLEGREFAPWDGTLCQDRWHQDDSHRAEVARVSKIVGAYSRMPRSTIEKHVSRMIARSRV